MNDLNSMAPIIAAATGVLALLFAVVLAKRVTTEEPGKNKKTKNKKKIKNKQMQKNKIK